MYIRTVSSDSPLAKEVEKSAMRVLSRSGVVFTRNQSVPSQSSPFFATCKCCPEFPAPTFYAKMKAYEAAPSSWLRNAASTSQIQSSLTTRRFMEQFHQSECQKAWFSIRSNQAADKQGTILVGGAEDSVAETEVDEFTVNIKTADPAYFAVFTCKKCDTRLVVVIIIVVRIPLDG